MSIIFLVLLLTIASPISSATIPCTIHVYVALCDNENQGIVPVPAFLGNGEDPKNNLYWGAKYGVKTYFKRSGEWRLLSIIDNPRESVLERCVFVHKSGDRFLVADAYRGNSLKQAIKDFLDSSAGRNKEDVVVKKNSEKANLGFGGNAQLIAYVGHNGLMDFILESYPAALGDKGRDTIILACHSKAYFAAPLRAAGAKPLLWTTGLMAPEAYTLKSALDGWILDETDEEIRERAAGAYSRYQKCSLKAAKRLLVTGTEK